MTLLRFVFSHLPVPSPLPALLTPTVFSRPFVCYSLPFRSAIPLERIQPFWPNSRFSLPPVAVCSSFVSPQTTVTLYPVVDSTQTFKPQA